MQRVGEVVARERERQEAGFRARLAEVDAELAGCGQPWHRLRAAELLLEAHDLRHRLDPASVPPPTAACKVGAGRREVARFQRLLEGGAALLAARQAAQAAKPNHPPHAQSAPRAGGKKRGVQPGGVGSDGAGGVARALLEEYGLEPPRVEAAGGDTCSACGVDMVVVANDSLLVCPACSLTRAMPNATAAAGASSNEGDYSNHGGGRTKSRGLEIMEASQAMVAKGPSPAAVAALLRSMADDGATGLEPLQPLLAREVAARGRFATVDDALARIGVASADAAAAGAATATDDSDGEGPPSAGRWEEGARRAAAQVQAALLGLTHFAVIKAMQRAKAAAAAEGDGATAAAIDATYERTAGRVGALLSGYWPPRMSGRQRETVVTLWAVAQAAMGRLPKRVAGGGLPQRAPFLLHKLVRLLGWREFERLYPLPHPPGPRLAKLEAAGEAVFRECGWAWSPHGAPDVAQRWAPGARDADGAQVAGHEVDFNAPPPMPDLEAALRARRERRRAAAPSDPSPLAWSTAASAEESAALATAPSPPPHEPPPALSLPPLLAPPRAASSPPAVATSPAPSTVPPSPSPTPPPRSTCPLPPPRAGPRRLPPRVGLLHLDEPTAPLAARPGLNADEVAWVGRRRRRPPSPSPPSPPSPKRPRLSTGGDQSAPEASGGLSAIGGQTARAATPSGADQ